MASKTDEKWMANYEALKAYILERGHLPDKHVEANRSLLSWAKRNESCLNHYSPPVQPSILEGEERNLSDFSL